jgi:hypothetical protein
MKLYEINAEILRLTDAIEFDRGDRRDPRKMQTTCSTQIQAPDAEEIHSRLAGKARPESPLRGGSPEGRGGQAQGKTYTALQEGGPSDEGARPRVCRREDRPWRCDLLLSQDLPCGCLRFRKSSPVAQAQQVHLDCFRIPAPEVAKAEVKKLISSGDQGAGLQRGQRLQLLTQIRRATECSTLPKGKSTAPRRWSSTDRRASASRPCLKVPGSGFIDTEGGTATWMSAASTSRSPGMNCFRHHQGESHPHPASARRS